MDQRELSILIGQCFNLAHSEYTSNKNLGGLNPDEYISKRTKELLQLQLEIRKDLRANKE